MKLRNLDNRLARFSVIPQGKAPGEFTEND
jgi:hypothetical protein